MCNTTRDLAARVGDHVSEYETVLEGARKLAALDVATLPICAEDGAVLGLLSRRDVVRVVAERRDPDAVRVGCLVGTLGRTDVEAALEVAAVAPTPIAVV